VLKVKKSIIAVLFMNVFFALSLFSFSQENDTGQNEKQRVLLEDKIVAVVNGEVITSNKLEERIAFVKSMSNRNTLNEDSNSEIEVLRKNVLNQLIEEIILLQEAKKQNITITEEELEPAKIQILISKLLNREIDSKIEITDSEAISYYNDNKNLYVEPERVRIEEVFLMVKPGSNIEDWELAKKRIDELYQTIKNSNDFLMAAKGLDEKISVGRSGFLIRGELPPEVEEVAFNTDIGKLSTVIKSPLGFHIIKLMDKRQQRQKEFEEVKDHIRRVLFGQKARQRYEDWIARLKTNSIIDIRQDKGSSK